MRESSSPSHDRRYRAREVQRSYLVYPPAGSIVEGRALLPPQNRANLIMGNANAVPRQEPPTQQQRSNLSVLLERKSSSSAEPLAREAVMTRESVPSEADSASGPSVSVVHCNSAPSSVGRSRVAPPTFLPVTRTHSLEHPNARRGSTGDVASLRPVGTGTTPTGGASRRDESVRRCVCL